MQRFGGLDLANSHNKLHIYTLIFHGIPHTFIQFRLANTVTAQTFTHALYDLATNPQYIQALREEVEGILTEKGWTKAAMDEMRKVDSFLKESIRLNGIQLCAYYVVDGIG